MAASCYLLQPAGRLKGSHRRTNGSTNLQESARLIRGRHAAATKRGHPNILRAKADPMKAVRPGTMRVSGAHPARGERLRLVSAAWRIRRFELIPIGLDGRASATR